MSVAWKGFNLDLGALRATHLSATMLSRHRHCPSKRKFILINKDLPLWRLLVTLQSFPASTGRFYLVSLISKMLHMQESNLRPQSYEPCALPTTPMCNVVVIDRIELSTSMVSAWRSTVELYHSMSGHTVTIRVLLLKRQEHHLNALAGNFPASLSKSIFLL